MRVCVREYAWICVCMSTSVGVSPTCCCVRLGCPFVWWERTGDRKRKGEALLIRPKSYKNRRWICPIVSLSISFLSLYFDKRNENKSTFFFSVQLPQIYTHLYTLIMFQGFKSPTFSFHTCCMQMMSNVFMFVWMILLLLLPWRLFEILVHGGSPSK